MAADASPPLRSRRRFGCFTMLGVAAWKGRNYNLAVKAFEKAISLNSPQTDVLQAKVAGLNYYINNSPESDRGISFFGTVFFVCLAIFVCCCAIAVFRFLRRLFGAGK